MHPARAALEKAAAFVEARFDVIETILHRAKLAAHAFEPHLHLSGEAANQLSYFMEFVASHQSLAYMISQAKKAAPKDRPFREA